MNWISECCNADWQYKSPENGIADAYCSKCGERCRLIDGTEATKEPSDE